MKRASIHYLICIFKTLEIIIFLFLSNRRKPILFIHVYMKVWNIYTYFFYANISIKNSAQIDIHVFIPFFNCKPILSVLLDNIGLVCTHWFFLLSNFFKVKYWHPLIIVNFGKLKGCQLYWFYSTCCCYLFSPWYSHLIFNSFWKRTKCMRQLLQSFLWNFVKFYFALSNFRYCVTLLITWVEYNS